MFADQGTMPPSDPISPDDPPSQSDKVPLDASDWTDCGNFNLSPAAAANACLSILASRTTTDADRSVAFSLQGQAFHLNGQYGDAMNNANNAILFDSQNALGYGLRGLEYMRLGQWEKSGIDYDKAIELWPNLSDRTNFNSENRLDSYYYGRGSAYANLKNPWKALPDMNEAIRISRDKGNNAAYYFYQRAKIQETLGNRDHAIADYKAALPGAGLRELAQEGADRLENTDPPPVSDMCVVVAAPISGGVGCAPGKVWYWTDVTVRKNRGCPDGILVQYFAPDTHKLETISIPARLQTCGEGVTAVRVSQ
jgi:tetratricopeptide (TPR) repeat protein